MSFDPSGRYQDRIESSANAYNNPYRQDPDSSRGYTALHSHVNMTQDTIESQQQRLERHLVDQFTKNQFKMPTGSVVAVIIQVGRYIVLAIVMPPYIFIYGAPKWLLAQLAPLIQKLLNESGEKLQTVFLRVSAWSKDVFGNLLNKLQELKAKRAEKKKSYKGDNLFQLLVKDLKKQLPDIKKPLLLAAEQIAKFYTAYVQTKEQIKQAFKEKIHNAKEKVKEKTLDLAALIRDQSIKTLERTTKYLKPKVETTLKIVQKAASIVDKTIEKTAQPFIAGFTAVQTAIPAIVLPIFSFMNQNIVTPVQTGIKLAAKPIEVLRGAIVATAAFTRQKVEAGVQIFLNFGAALATRSQKVLDKVFQNFELYQKVFVERARVVARALKQAFEPVKKYAKKLIERSKEKARQQYQQAKEKAVAIAKALKKAAIVTAQKAKRLPGIFYRAFLRLMRHLYHGIKKTLFGIRLILTWIKILVRYSLVGQVKS